MGNDSSKTNSASNTKNGEESHEISTEEQTWKLMHEDTFTVNEKALMSEYDEKKYNEETFGQALTHLVGAGKCISYFVALRLILLRT